MVKELDTKILYKFEKCFLNKSKTFIFKVKKYFKKHQIMENILLKITSTLGNVETTFTVDNSKDDNTNQKPTTDKKDDANNKTK